MRDLFAVVDASSRDNFEKLTLHRMPGALPFAGKFRLIDFTLSNLKHAHVTNVAIFPSGNYRSLQDHIGSGKRWHLDRRRDGLFILPPKNMMLPLGDMLTFQRMHEHIEYFRRSTQKYVLITQASLVWNVDFQAMLDAHVASQADISEVMTPYSRLKTFILSKDLLLKYILDYDALPYKTMNDLVWRSPKVRVNTITHEGYTRLIDEPSVYLRANLDMLAFEIGSTIFRNDRPIVSKEKTAPPARYSDASTVTNSMVSSGSYIRGHIEKSIIGRDVIIKEGAHVKNSFVMNNAVVERGAVLDHVILDKDTVVKADTIVEGTIDSPYVTEKGQIITDQSDLRVLIVASEANPYVKTGGLADVIEGLSRALSKKGVDTNVVIPLYKSIKDNYAETYQYVASETFDFGGEPRKIRIYTLLREKVRYYFIEYFPFFEREETYGYEDDCLRFAFFNYAVYQSFKHIGPFDLLHLNDWHTGLLPGLMQKSEDRIPTLLTIHNIDYQGQCDASLLHESRPNALIPTVNFLETGISEASKLSTVSETYRDELRYDYYGGSLTPLLLKRERDFHGVLNGLPKKYSPVNDPNVFSPYDRQSIGKKSENKLHLQEKMQLSLGVEKFTLGMVSRITEQKGFPILIPALSTMLERYKALQFVLLGSGEDRYIESLRELEKAHPGRVRLNIGFDAANPAHIYAGADAFLMPSRVEPCGLSQMIAMRYGTPPIARKTGGLADSIVDYDPITRYGTGFTFFNYDAEALAARIDDAYKVFHEHKDEWRRIMDAGMRADFSIERQAQKMLEIYQSMV